MNSEQILSLVRDILKVGGTIAGLLGVASSTIDQTTAFVLMIAGPLTTVAGVLWSQLRHTEAGQVTATAKLAESPDSSVKAIVVEQTAAGRNLRESVASPTVVSAGTAAAAANAAAN